MSDLQFVHPASAYLPSYLDVIKHEKFSNMDLRIGDWSAQKIENDPDAYFAHVNDVNPIEVTLKDGTKFVLQDRESVWLVEGDHFIGSLPLRYHADAQFIETYCGHIGVAIRSDHQGEGYGSCALQYGLQKMRAKGIRDVFISCHPQNAASKKMIEAAGGRLKASYDDVYGIGPILMYVIEGNAA